MSNTPKYSINERVMVRCHEGNCVDGDPLYIDDCVIVEIEIIPAGEDVFIYGDRLYKNKVDTIQYKVCLLYTSPSPRDGLLSRMPSSA